MACWNRLNALAFLITILVFVQLVDETFCRRTFVVAPRPSSEPALSIQRIRRDTDTDAESTKPVVKSLRIDSVIKYRYANTVVYSKIVNSANESREIGFTTVLPDDAFISGFAITMNGTVYKAYVKEKEEARNIYQEAVASGRTAGHVELSARDSNTFTVSVNVEAFGKVAFNLTYEELLARELGTYKHKISLNPGQIVKDMSVQVIIQESSDIVSLRVPDLRETNEILAEDDSENQRVTKEQPNGTTAIIRWAPTPDEQKEINSNGVKGLLEVRYDVDRVSHPNQILVNQGYFVHYFAPPNLNPLNKHVVFVLDRSGSMYGSKIEQLKEAMGSILDELRSGDSFSIVLFSDMIYLWLSNGQQVEADQHGEPISPLAIASATPENIETAKSTVNTTEASGGTHIYDALKTALRVVSLGHSSAENDLNSESVKEPMIIFLTDGQANGPNSESETIINDTTASNGNKCVIYGLAFGSDADFGLLKKLSLKNSGFARKIYEASDASLQLKNFYREVSSPLLSGVTFHYLDDQVDVTSLTKIHFRTHNNGSEIVVAGRLANSNAVTGSVTAQSATGNISLEAYPTVEVTDLYPREPLVQNASQAGFMERLWAYLTIKQLLDQKEQSDENNTVKAEALQLALKYSFVTPLTSLVVVKPNETDTATELKETQPESLPLPSFARAAAGYPQALGGSFQYTHFQSADRSLVLGAMPRPGRRRGYARRYGQAMPSPKRLTTPAPAYHETSTGTALLVEDAIQPVSNIVPLSSYLWFSSLSNDTHITLLVNGAEETLKIGYHEVNIAHNQCAAPEGKEGHCRHLPLCALPVFAQDINTYLQYFCKIDSFIGVCCPDEVFALPTI